MRRATRFPWLPMLAMLTAAACGREPTAPKPTAPCVTVDTLYAGKDGVLILTTHYQPGTGPCARKP